LVALFERRMEVSRQVAEYKLQNGLPVLDQGREEEVILSRAAMLRDHGLDPSVKALYKEIMRLGRGEQERLMKRGRLE
jgi:chorismate mutase